MEIYMNSSLDLFSKPKLASNVLKTEEMFFMPVTSLSEKNSMEFQISSLSDLYLDLSSCALKLNFQIVKKNGEPIDSYETAEENGNRIGVENCFLHALIKQVNLSMNGKNIQNVDNLYTFRSYMETLLNFSEESKKSQLKNILFDGDECPENFLTNAGWIQRSKDLASSKINEVYGKLHCDMLNQPLYLLNNVDLRIKLTLNSEEFYMLCEKSESDCCVKILDARLYIKAITLNPALLLSHQLLLEENSMSYFYKKVEMKTFTLYPGTQSCNLHNVSMGTLPRRLFFAMVDDECFSGVKNKPSLNFKHNFITSVVVSCNSSQTPLDPIVMDFKNNIYSRAYSTLFSSVGLFYTHASHLITKSMFSNGFFIIGIDLQDSHTQIGGILQNQGNISLNATFAEKLKATTTAICYLEYAGCAQIDKNRNISLS
jgi:hypothetical protein